MESGSRKQGLNPDSVPTVYRTLGKSLTSLLYRKLRTLTTKLMLVNFGSDNGSDNGVENTSSLLKHSSSVVVENFYFYGYFFSGEGHHLIIYRKRCSSDAMVIPL